MVIDTQADGLAAVARLRWYVERARDIAPAVTVFLVTNQVDPSQPTSDAYRRWYQRRMVTDRKASFVHDGFRDLGCEIVVFESDLDFIRFIQCDFARKANRTYLAYEIGLSGFGAAERTLVPTFCRRYGLHSMNSAGSARVLAWHKGHSAAILAHHGVPVPRTWVFSTETGWINDGRPPPGRKVVAKSTYSAMAVGVSDRSVFFYEEREDERLAAIEREMGEPVTVQDFVPGEEIYLTLLETEALMALPPVALSLRDGTSLRDTALTFERNQGDRMLAFTPFSFDEERCGCRARMIGAAATAFRILEFAVIGRFDFRLTETGDLFLFDIAETPSLSDYHATARSCVALGLDYGEIPGVLVALNLMRYGLVGSPALPMEEAPAR